MIMNDKLHHDNDIYTMNLLNYYLMESRKLLLNGKSDDVRFY